MSLIAACENCSKKKITEVNKIAAVGLCKDCSIASTIYNRYYAANIPLEYWDLRIGRSKEDAKANFKGPSKLIDIYFELSEDLSKWYLSGRSLCLAGTHGIGKSTVATNILKRVCQKNLGALYTTLSDAVAVLTSAPIDEKFLARKELLETDFIVVDEVDSRFAPSENASDLFGRTLESVIRTRISNKLPTLLISNSPNPKEMFSGALKASIDSLMSKIPIVPLIGKDYRKEGVNEV